MNDLPPFDQMHLEWEAWTEGVVPEFQKRGIDMNAPEQTTLVLAIHRWGEELADLRSRQDTDVCLTALMQKRQQYEEAGK